MIGDGLFIAASVACGAITKLMMVAVAIPKSVFFNMGYSFFKFAYRGVRDALLMMQTLKSAPEPNLG